MKPLDVRLLCTALGFTAIASRDGRAGAETVMALASLIEDFCRSAVPDAIEEANENDGTDKPVPAQPGSPAVPRVTQRMAGAIVELHKQQSGCLPQDLIAKGFTAEEIADHGSWRRRWRPSN